GGDRAAAARRVLDEERLPERLAHLQGDGAADEVEPATGLRRHDDLHGLGGVLREGQRGDQREQQEQAFHRRNSISASSVASGASAISEWPEASMTTVLAPGICSCRPFAARGGVIMSRLPRMKSAGQPTLPENR